MAGINAVVLVGNLTKDPELRTTQGGESVCGLRIAINGREKVGDQWRDRADYFDVRVWGSQADSCAQYLKRGSPVGIDGRLRHEEWVPQGGGDKKYRVLVVAKNVQFLERRGDGGGHESAAFVPDEEFQVPTAEFGTGGDFTPTGAAADPDDDIPF